MAQPAKRIARSWAGIGSTLLGRRDYGADGSWITTKWSIFASFPIRPMRSYRIRPQGKGYEVLWEGSPVLK